MTNMFYSKAFLSNNNDDAEEEWFLSQLDKMSTTETPLSPPLGKKERAQTTRPYGTNGRTLSFSGAFSCANNKGWHSLWSNPTWQTSNDASSDNSSQRTRSVSALQLPSISNLSLYNNISSATTAAVDDYFGNHDSTNTATISSACTLTHDFNKSAFPSPLSTGTTVHAACTPAAAIGTAPMTDNRQNNENNNIITANYLYNLKLNGNNDRLCWSVDSIPSHPLKSTLNRHPIEERRHSIAVTPPFSTLPCFDGVPPYYRLQTPGVDSRSWDPMHPNRPPTPPSYSFATDSSYVNKEHTQQIQQQQIDEYFSRNTKTPSIPTVQDFGKGIPNDQLKPDQSVYKVQFRCNRRFNYYYLSADTNIDVKINDSVIVQGDRGYDLGEVTKIIHNKQLHGCHTVKRIFRIATTEDMNSYTLLREDEAEALEFCKELIKEKELDMEVVEAEYQWDRRRLTFYYTSPEQRIDFRELVRQLFKIYKTRIWMYQINHQLKTTEFRK